jgi:BASS family bile acid:Na+ symporter
MGLAGAIEVGLPIALAFIMLSMGMTLKPDDFRRVIVGPRAFLVGLGAQMVVVPLLALFLQWAFRLPPLLVVGLMVLSFSPGGTSSNLFSYLARGDVALSVALTAITSLITPFTLPLLTEAVLQMQLGEGRQVSIPVVQTMMRLLLVSVIPLLAGMAWYRFGPVSAGKAQARLHRFSMLLFFAVIVLIVVQQFSKPVNFVAEVALVAMAMILSALVAAFALARLFDLNQQQQKTVVFETGLQNGGMALIVTQGVLHSPTMSVVPIVYGLLMLIPVVTYSLAVRMGKIP